MIANPSPNYVLQFDRSAFGGAAPELVRWASLRIAFISLAMFVLCSCAVQSIGDSSLEIQWQLRWSLAEDNGVTFGYEFVDESGFVAGGLNRNWLKADDTYKYFSWAEAPISSRYRWLVVRNQQRQIARVFEVHLPRVLTSCTKWGGAGTARRMLKTLLIFHVP